MRHEIKFDQIVAKTLKLRYPIPEYYLKIMWPSFPDGQQDISHFSHLLNQNSDLFDENPNPASNTFQKFNCSGPNKIIEQQSSEEKEHSSLAINIPDSRLLSVRSNQNSDTSRSVNSGSKAWQTSFDKEFMIVEEDELSVPDLKKDNQEQTERNKLRQSKFQNSAVSFGANAISKNLESSQHKNNPKADSCASSYQTPEFHLDSNGQVIVDMTQKSSQHIPSSRLNEPERPILRPVRFAGLQKFSLVNRIQEPIEKPSTTEIKKPQAIIPQKITPRPSQPSPPPKESPVNQIKQPQTFEPTLSLLDKMKKRKAGNVVFQKTLNANGHQVNRSQNQPEQKSIQWRKSDLANISVDTFEVKNNPIAQQPKVQQKYAQNKDRDQSPEPTTFKRPLFQSRITNLNKSSVQQLQKPIESLKPQPAQPVIKTIPTFSASFLARRTDLFSFNRISPPPATPVNPTLTQLIFDTSAQVQQDRQEFYQSLSDKMKRKQQLEETLLKLSFMMNHPVFTKCRDRSKSSKMFKA